MAGNQAQCSLGTPSARNLCGQSPARLALLLHTPVAGTH